MPRPNPYRPYRPCPEQQALIPDISGNSINGLDETEPRPPRYIYWNDPDKLAHGALQRWFYHNDPDNEALRLARQDRAAITDFKLPPVAGPAPEYDNSKNTTKLLEQVKEFDFEMTGITAMKPEFLYHNTAIDHQWVVMIAVIHDYVQISEAPRDKAGAEVVRQYGRAMRGAMQTAAWIRNRGYDAQPHTGPLAGKLLMIPPAIACGFGELGKHGSLINRQHGSNFRLSAVTTSMPLNPTEAPPMWVDDFCINCRICENACPPEAISPDKQLVRGRRKWYVDFDKCIPFFNENFGCAICIAQCPWSRPGTAPRLSKKIARRHEKNVALSKS